MEGEFSGEDLRGFDTWWGDGDAHIDDPSDLEGVEVGDRTVMRPDMLPPAGPSEDSSGGGRPGASPRNGGKASEDHELEIDGDATVLVAPSDLPAKAPNRSSTPGQRLAAMIITN